MAPQSANDAVEDDAVEALDFSEYNESIDTALATIQENQVQLSQMADSKANIMITVSSILLTLAIARVEEGTLLLPSVVFAAFCAPALIFAVLCVLPTPAHYKKSVSKAGMLPHFNPLFFMHFTLLPFKRFEREIGRVLSDPQLMYRKLIEDIYWAGMVLRVKKYRYLRWSYYSLLTGIIAACIALLVDLAK